MATPVLLLVVLYLIYAVIFFRQPRGGALEGPAVRGNTRVQTTWIVVTSALVLALAAFGTVRLEADYGARLGQRAEPADGPRGAEAAGAGDRAAVEVHLPLPDLRRRRDHRSWCCRSNEMVEFHVTSLDVIHSFWAYKLGVKADANPGVDNVAFVKPTQARDLRGPLRRAVRPVARLMFDYGHVVVSAERVQQPGSTTAGGASPRRRRSCPQYSTTYLPEPTRRGE